MPANYGAFGRVPHDILLYILGHADLRTVLTAERVSDSWRALIQRDQSLWRSLFLSFKDVDETVKWHLLELDGRGMSLDPDPAFTPMPEGDGRAVSGPPIDKAMLYMLALDSLWKDDVMNEINQLSPDDPMQAILDPIFDDDGRLRRDENGHIHPELPPTTDLVYQWGTRRDKPDWRQHCIRHMASIGDAIDRRVASTITVPLRVRHFQGLVEFVGEDPGDDALLFVTSEADPHHDDRWLICVERTTGEIRHVSVLPPEVRLKVFRDVGLWGEQCRASVTGTRPYISGPSFNHLCRHMSSVLPRDRYFHPLGKLHGETRFYDADVCNGRDHLEMSWMVQNVLKWEKITDETFPEPDEHDDGDELPDESNARYWYGFTVYDDFDWDEWGGTTKFTDRYVLFNLHNQVLVRSRATGEPVVRLSGASESSKGSELARFVYRHKYTDTDKLGIRNVQLTPVSPTERMYPPKRIDGTSPVFDDWEKFLSQEKSDHDKEQNDHDEEGDMQLTEARASLRGIERMFVTRGKTVVFELHQGHIVIPDMDAVLDGACTVPRKERAKYIAQHSVLIMSESTIHNLNHDISKVEWNFGEYDPKEEEEESSPLRKDFINFGAIPPISPDMPPPPITIFTVTTPPLENTWGLSKYAWDRNHFTFYDGFALEIFHGLLDDDVGECEQLVLRITHFEPVLEA